MAKKQEPTVRVKQLVAMSGFRFDDDNNITGDLVHNPGKEYETTAAEAERLVSKGYAEIVPMSSGTTA